MFDCIMEFLARFAALPGKVAHGPASLIQKPFIRIKEHYRRSHGFMKVLLAITILCTIILYTFFFWNALWVRNFDPDYAEKLNFMELSTPAGEQVAIEGGGDTTRTCGQSAIVETTATLIDFNVNQNSWMSGWLLYRAGLFGIPWDVTPWFDNKASFQRGVHRAVKRAAIDLAEHLGRVRGTAQINASLQKARGALQVNEFNWYFGVNPFGFKPTPWSSYRQARRELLTYNSQLTQCEATFDARADNLRQFMESIAKDIGSASAVIKERAEQYDNGWFDTLADNIFMESLGQLYAYYGLFQAARHDFHDIIESRALTNIWDSVEAQTRSALQLDPFIISNGKEDGAFMPTHLTTIGFYILRVRSNLVEIRSALDR